MPGSSLNKTTHELVQKEGFSAFQPQVFTGQDSVTQVPDVGFILIDPKTEDFSCNAKCLEAWGHPSGTSISLAQKLLPSCSSEKDVEASRAGPGALMEAALCQLPNAAREGLLALVYFQCLATLGQVVQQRALWVRAFSMGLV